MKIRILQVQSSGMPNLGRQHYCTLPHYTDKKRK
jgi:hypothetical protein